MEKKGELTFGYSNDKNPNGTWESMTFGDKDHISKADYYGTITYNGNNYLITKITEAWNQEKVGQFFVINATAKTFEDESGTIFLNQTQSEKAIQLEDALNHNQYSSIEDIINDEKNNYEAGNETIQNIIEKDDSCPTTAIKNEEFYLINKDFQEKYNINPAKEVSSDDIKIEFGYSNNIKPNGTWESITFSKENPVSTAKYYGIVERAGNNYMITQITDSWDEEKIGEFFVTDISAKTYEDQSGIIFLDQTQSVISEKLQKDLNSNKYSTIEEIINNNKNDFEAGNEKIQELITKNNTCSVTAINHEAYKKIDRSFKEKMGIPTIKREIEFGYSNDKNPNGSWEGMSFNDESHVCNATYYGLVSKNGKNYMITKITDARNEEKIGKFFVVDTTVKTSENQDLTNIILLDQTQSDIALILEERLNNGKYSNIDDILNDKDIKFKDGNKIIEDIIDKPEAKSLITTAISHEEFEKIEKNFQEKEALDNKKINLNLANSFFEAANVQTNTQNTVPIKKQWREFLSQKVKDLDKDTIKDIDDQISK